MVFVEARENSYVDSCKNFLTLYMVIKAVGEEEIIMIGQEGPRSNRLERKVE